MAAFVAAIFIPPYFKDTPTLPKIPDIDFTYPNNWRAPEYTHSSFKMQTTNLPCPEADSTLQYIDPLPVILERAKKAQIVMINESHFKPIHRAFIGKISTYLHDQGFTHFGSELLHQDDISQLERTQSDPTVKYLLDSGYAGYTDDPIYGHMIEGLAKTGFSFFSYEEDISNPPAGTIDSVTYRDSLSAQNIDAYMKRFPNQKFIIHAGYNHVKEYNTGSRSQWMAEQFKSLSGINPLTISQTECRGVKYFNDNFMGYGLLADQDGVPISSDGYDLILAASAETYFHERPLWLRDLLGRKFVDLPKEAKFDGETDFTLIKAKNVDRADNALPEDIIYRPPYSDKVLALRPGHYKLEISDRNKDIISNSEIVVK